MVIISYKYSIANEFPILATNPNDACDESDDHHVDP